MKKNQRKQTRLLRNQKGFTLLEYCAGAAVLAGVVYVAMQGFGDNLSKFMDGLGNWATRRTAQIASN